MKYLIQLHKPLNAPNAPPNAEAILYIPAATPTFSNGAFAIAVSVDGVA